MSGHAALLFDSMKLLIATGNAHKLEEICDLLRGVADLEIVSLRDFPDLEMPPETGATMRENARIKAWHCARESGLPSLADDSGIEVRALDDAPGVHSARWIEGSDEDRMFALLRRMENIGVRMSTHVEEEARAARYRCAICLCFSNGAELESEATCEGRITFAPRGANGFGYDPIFEITEATGAPDEWLGLTMAEAPPQVKAQVSHRARALRILVQQILAQQPGL